MTRKLSFLFALLALSTSRNVAKAEALTYAEFLQRAQATSLEKAKAELGMRQSGVDRAALEKKDDLKASITGSAGAKYTPVEPEATPRPTGRAATTPQPWGSLDGSFSLQLSRTLFDFGRLDSERKKADLQVEAKRMEILQAEEQLVWKTARAFSKVLAAGDVARLTRQQLANAEAKRKLTAENFGKGLRSENDLSRADVDLGRARLAARRAEDELVQARIQLGLATGQDVSEPPARPLPEARGSLQKNAEKWKALAASWGQMQATASDDLRAAQKATNRAELEAIDARTWPTVTASTNLTFTRTVPLPTTENSSRKTSLGAQLAFNWDIPWNGAYRDDQEKVTLRELELDLQGQSERRLRTEKAATARGQLEALLAQLVLIEDQARLVERNLTLVRKKYEAGKATATELSNAEDEGITIRSDLVKSNNAVAAATLDLAEASGIRDVSALFQE